MTPLEVKLIALLRKILNALESQGIPLRQSYVDKEGRKAYTIVTHEDKYLCDVIAAELKTWEEVDE